MVDVAIVTVTAAETEEAIGVGSGSGEDSDPSRDPELLVRALNTLLKCSRLYTFTYVFMCVVYVGTNKACSCDSI